jgi:hypothetical protein
MERRGEFGRRGTVASVETLGATQFTKVTVALHAEIVNGGALAAVEVNIVDPAQVPEGLAVDDEVWIVETLNPNMSPQFARLEKA